MKHLFCYIVFFFLFFNGSNVFGAAPNLPEDFEGKVTRQRAEEYALNPNTRPQLAQLMFMLYEVGEYLYKKYPIEEFENEDFIENLRPFFPEDNDDELQEWRHFFRRSFTLYKKGRDVYTQFAQRYLVPHTYRKVHHASEYDHYGEVPYMKAADGKFFKVYNFKKFISYGQSEDERNAISDFERAQKDNPDVLTQIDRIAEKIEWKKLLLYGTYYKNPLFSELGESETLQGENVKIRLLSQNIYTEQKDELYFGLHIMPDNGIFVLANNLSPSLKKPVADFSLSENVAAAELLYPIPIYTNVLPYAHKYFGDFMLPIKVRLADNKQPVTLRTSGSITLCNLKMDCRQQPFFFEMKLDVSGTDLFSNGYNNFFFQSLNRIPSDDISELKLQDFSVKQNKVGQTLLLVFKTKKKVGSFYLFLEDNEGYTKFYNPRYTLQNGKIYAYIEAQNEGKPLNLARSEYTVSANLNNRFLYRKALVPEVAFTDAPSADKYLMLFYAFLCGLGLLLTPCSLALFILMITVTRHVYRQKQIAPLRSIILFLSGTFIAFVLLAFMPFKVQNFIAVWGTQFSCSGYFAAILFGTVAFAALLPTLLGLIKEIGNKYLKTTLLSLGLLSVWGATSFTLPYLSDTVSYAFSGGFKRYFSTIFAVFVGFAAPCLLLLNPRNSLWRFIDLHIRHTEKVLKIILYLAAAWYLLLILLPNGWVFTLGLALITLVIGFICGIFQKFWEYTDGVLDESISRQNLHKIVRGSYILCSVLLLVAVILGIHTVGRHQIAYYNQNRADTAKEVDFAAVEKTLKNNEPVLVIINAPWCLTCQINEHFRLNRVVMERLQARFKLKIIKVDMNKGSTKLNAYMHKYGRNDLPFYVLYTPLIKEGLVLPPTIQAEEINRILSHEYFNAL